jgi:hypothetical protein
MTSSDNLPTVPRASALAAQGAHGATFVNWFLNAPDEQRRAFVEAHGQTARDMFASGELTRSEVPATWEEAPAAAPWAPPEVLGGGQRVPHRRQLPGAAPADRRTGPACA